MCIKLAGRLSSPTQCNNCQKTRVVYRGVTSSFFGIGILRVSDLLDFLFRSVSIPPFFVYFPPFLPPFFQKGVELLKKGAIAPLLRKKGGTAPFLYRNVPTEFSFGIGMVNTEKYRPTENTESITLQKTKRGINFLP
jgi:hypothetical protein